MSARVSAVLFDMDGTLFDSTGCVTSAYRATVASCGVGEPTAEQVVAAYPLGPPRVMLTHLLGREAQDADEDAYLDALTRRADQVNVYPGIRALLGAIRDRGVPAAVFTGASAAAATCLLGATGLRPFLHVVVGGDEVPNPKPSPDGILETCQRLGVEPTAAIYVGDAPVDLGAARASGAIAVAAGWGHLYDPGQRSDAVARVPTEVLELIDA